MAGPTITVPAPTRAARVGGILSVSELIPADRLGIGKGVEWEENVCSVAFNAPGLCFGLMVDPSDDESPVEEAVKSANDGAGWANGIGEPFAGYYGVECYLSADNDFASRASAGLLEAEGSFLELMVGGRAFGAGAPALSPESSLLEAIAAAEAYADDRYAGSSPSYTESGYIGRPIIWLSRGDAVRAGAATAIFGDGSGNLWTINGTPVGAMGSLADGAVWVSGQLAIYHSEVIVTNVIEPLSNREMAIAERVYAAGFDCLEPVKVPITTPGD